MARFTCLVVATALLLAAALPVRVQGADDPPVCSGYKLKYKLSGGAIASGPNAKQAAAVAEQLAAWVADEAHLKEGCEVTDWLIEAACRRSVKKGQPLTGGFTVERSGRLYDMQVVEQITCPDGGFKVRYQVRGIVPNSHKNNKSVKVVDIQTRFMDNFDSTYV